MFLNRLWLAVEVVRQCRSEWFPQEDRVDPIEDPSLLIWK